MKKIMKKTTVVPSGRQLLLTHTHTRTPRHNVVSVRSPHPPHTSTQNVVSVRSPHPPHTSTQCRLCSFSSSTAHLDTMSSLFVLLIHRTPRHNVVSVRSPHPPHTSTQNVVSVRSLHETSAACHSVADIGCGCAAYTVFALPVAL